MKNVSKSRLTFDLAEAVRFLNVIGKGERFTFQIFDDSPLRRKDLALIRHGSLDMHSKQFCESNENGAGIFVMINKGNERGRTIDSVKEVRALFVDMDNAPIELLFNSPLKPHIIVETSPGRGHAYFVVSDMNLKDFSRFQKALARYFGGDELINDLCRVMRIPGFCHRKTETPFMVKIKEVNEMPPYSREDVIRAFGLNEVVGQKTMPCVVPELQRIPDGIIPEGQRNSTLTRIAGLMRFSGAKEAEIQQGLLLENQHRCSPPLSGHEVVGIAKSVAKYEPSNPKTISDEMPITGSAKSDKTSTGEPGAQVYSWPDPLPLIETLLPVMAFDYDLLPEALRAWVKDVAERMQCPADFIAAGAMVVAGSLVGRQIGVMPKRHDNWLVVPNIWGAIVGRPGVMKSPALGEVMAFLEHAERDAAAEHKKENVEWQAQKLIQETNKEVGKANLKKILSGKNASQPSSGAEVDAIARTIVGDQDAEKGPQRKRYKVNDSTVEKLGEILAVNPNGVLIHRDELTGLINSLDKDGHEKDRAFYLEAWSGTQETFTYDRIGRGTIDINFPCVSILGGIQPGPLIDYCKKASIGNKDDGFIQRLQVTVWPDIPKTWKNIDRKCDEKAKQEAFEVFERLRNVDVVRLAAERSEGHQIHYLRFGPMGNDRFTQYREELESRVRSGDEDAAFESHLAKYRSLVPSIALILHLIDYPEIPEVNINSVNRAIKWASYLESHARRLYGAVAAGNVSAAQALLGRIKKGKLTSPFVARDIYRNHWRGLDSLETVKEALDILEAHLFIKGFMMQGSDGRPGKKYFVNPKCLVEQPKG